MKQPYTNLKLSFRPLYFLALLSILFFGLSSFTNIKIFDLRNAKVLENERHDPPQNEVCSPISILACEDIIKGLPLNLNFTEPVLNTLGDVNGTGTGFTAALEHSEARRSGDLPVSNAAVNGYEPSLISINNGGLELKSQAGINYLNPPESSNNNNQVNTLGIGLQSIVTPLTLETTLINITTGTGSAQAGIWFGIDEDNFVKLNVLANSVELRKELGGRSINGDTSPDQILIDNLGTVGQNVKLRMVVDPIAMSITAYYAINGGDFIQVTKSDYSALSLPEVYLSGRDLNSEISDVSFAGIYATHRNGSQFTARFDSFSAIVEKEELDLSFDKEALIFESIEGDVIDPQSVSLTANKGNPTFSLSDDPSSGDWLILPVNPELGVLEFNIKPDLAPNTYSTTIIAIPSNGDYTSAELQVSLVVRSKENARTENDISDFDITSATGPAVLNLEGHLVNIEVERGTDLTALTPVIGVSAGASISPDSGVVQDFTNPVLYTVTAEDGTMQEWSVRVTEAALENFSFIENFETYSIGNLHEVSNGAWSKERVTDASIPVVNEGLTSNTDFSIDLSQGQQTHDYETLISNPKELVAGQPFYFNTYFNVANLGVNTTDRIRSVVRIDDNLSGDQWIREQIAYTVDNKLVAMLGLEGSGSNQGAIAIDPGKTIQFVTRGVWDGNGTITYSWTIDPQLNLEQNVWTGAGTHAVQGTPRVGRIFIGSNGINNGSLGPIRLGTNYSEIVTEENTEDEPEAKPLLSLSPQRIVGDVIVDANLSLIKQITITNSGTAPLNAIEVVINGENAESFSINGIPQTVAPSESATFEVVFKPGSVGPKYASLRVTAADVNPMTVSLNGLGKLGNGGDKEPSLQWVLDTQLGEGAVTVGDNNADTNIIDLANGQNYNTLLGDELDIKSFERAASGNVTLEVLSAFGPEGADPVTAFGWYESGDSAVLNEIFTIGNVSGNGQTLNPVIDGATTFDPGTASFGFYSRWPFFNNRTLYSEDALNTFNGAIPHHVRVYELPGEENAYIIATEEHISGFDYQDIVVIARNIKPAGEEVAGCNPISILECDQLEVSLPYELSFDGTEGGLSNTGFTMVDNPSARIPQDGAINYPQVPGYEPSRISFSNGRMTLKAANGIAYVKNGTIAGTSTDVNSQINTLGVGINTAEYSNFSLRTTLVNPYSDATQNSEQAGLWFGLDEDNFAKLAIANGGVVELRTETNGLSVDSDAVSSQPIVNYNNSTINLRLYIDEVNSLLTGYYSVNGGGEVSIGSLSLPASYLEGKEKYDNISFAGIFSSKRREQTADVNYTFESFALEADDAITDTIDPININFSDLATASPAGYNKDSGDSYGDRGNGYSYGWLNAETNVPAVVTNSARMRTVSGVGVLNNSLIHMQYGNVDTDPSKGYLPDAKWELALPNGSYNIIVNVGDPELDSPSTSTPKHTINAEGVNVINQFIPTGVKGAATRFKSGSSRVVVRDGRLTIDPRGGFNTKINSIQIEQVGLSDIPYFTGVNPQDGAINVPVNGFQIAIEIVVPEGYELDKTTTSNAKIYEVTAGGEQLVPANTNDTGGGDAIILTPLNKLKENTTYILKMPTTIEANKIGDIQDRIAFEAFESRFTTGEEDLDTNQPGRDLTNVSFTQVRGAALGERVQNERFSSMQVGPDGKLYASTIGDFQSDGKIFRWDMSNDGTLTNLEVLSPELSGASNPVNGSPQNNDVRLIIGFRFDPNATAENLVAYITHSKSSESDGPEWDGKLTRLSGPKLELVQDVIIHLPRSKKDHLTNSLAFDINGDLFISQGSNTAGGEPDPAWAFRPERLLSGAILKVELDKLPGNLPLDAYTTNNIGVINSAPTNSITMSDGTYNPYATNSPLTIFATGIRNAYDLLWHSNGWLYVPTNGTAGNNTNSPNSPSTANYELARRIDGRTTVPNAPALLGGNTQKDWLFKTKGGTYHGHPNPYRGEFVLNHGGTSYSGLPGQVREPYKDVTKYPSNVQPDPNYMQPAFDFDFNKSPNGVIEYKSDAFEGKLKGLIMVVQFSGQDNLLLLDPGSNGDIAYNYNSVTGLGGFDDPIEVVEDPKTGNIYVSEYDRDGSSLPQLTLLRASDPAQPGAVIAANTKELIFETTVNNQGSQSQQKKVTISNEGAEVLNITGVSVSGNFADQFKDANPSGAQNIAPGGSVEYTITYAPNLDQSNIGYQDAAFVINSNDEKNPQFTIGLFGLKKKGYEGTGEPALQDVVNALGIGLDIGWTTLANNTDPDPIADEIEVERWVKLNAETPVRITPVGRYSPAESLPFGWYTNDGEIFTQEIGVLQDGLANAQTLYPPMESNESSVNFDPRGDVFGFYVESRSFGRFNYTEDILNELSGVAHRSRIYPNKDREGNIIPNSYLITFEDASNGDYQDYMFIMDNVVPFSEALLAFGFDKESLKFSTSVNELEINDQDVTLSVSGPIKANEISLDATEDWVVLPENFEFENPFNIGIDAEGLAIGNYTAVVTASATNYASASLSINLSVTDEVVYVYQFNFQTPDDIEISPEGYIDDIGQPYAAQSTDMGTVEFGWVLPGTLTPANAAVNARNRNTGTNDDPLLKTFNIIGHRTAATYPLRDWTVKLPNGSYFVNISVGENEFRDSNHVLDVNGITVVDFDQQNNNPNNLIYAEGTRLVDVTDGILRLSLNERGVNAKPNYIRIAPVNIATLPPTITATLDGLMFEENVYRGTVEVTLAAEDRSGSGSIENLAYIINGAPSIAYTEPFTVDGSGDYSILVEAEDGNGNTAVKTIEFSIEKPSGAVLYMENMTKIPGTQRGFPADDYYTFYRIGNPNTGGAAPNVALTHDTNIMRLNNTGTGTLIISDVQISDTRDYTYSFVNNIGEMSFPISIEPGASRDVQIRITASTTNGRSALFKENITIISNADNGGESIATLNGGFTPQPEGNDEITAQQVFDAFGFTSTMRSIVNDNGTITPTNSEPTRPSSNYPKAENIDAGYEGDLILSSNFVQADKSKPVLGLQLSALHGKGADNGRFVSVSGNTTVGGMDFRHTNTYYQTLLPNRGSDLNADRVSSISGSFRLAVANYLSSGGNNISGDRPDLLGLRVYKAKDQNGNIIPNEYIVLQDFIQNGCGAGSANCDWNDNTFYFINIRPEAVPSALPIEDLFVNVGSTFENDLSGYFQKGYPGNKLSFSATLADGSELPSWMEIDDKGNLLGAVPEDADPSYVLTITAKDLNGLLVTENALINVNSAPEAVIAATPLKGQSPLEVTFTGENSTDNGDLLSYLWDFSDGETSEDVNPVHVYNELGTYNAKLTVTDENGLEDSAIITITVAENVAPLALASADLIEGQAPLKVNFTGDNSSDDLAITNYQWNFGNDQTSEEINPTYTFEESGVYEVSLTVTDEKGLFDSQFLTITVNENTAPIAIASADLTEGKVAHTVNFSGDASTDDVEIVTYSWDFGNGTSSDEMNPQYTYETEGTYEVTLTVADDRGVENTSNAILISVLPANTAPVAIAEADVTSGAIPLAVQFTGSNSQDDSEVITYFWNFGNGDTSDEANPSYVFSQPGNYTVVLVVEDEEGQFGVATLTVTAGLDNTAPVAVIDGGPFTGNTPLDVYFVGDNSTDDKGVVSYIWDFGDGSFANVNNPTHRYNSPGSYLVQLTVYDAEGLQDNAQTSVIVNSVGGGAIAPIAVANANITQGTSPLPVNFDGSESSDDTGTIANYRWTLNTVEISNVATFDYVFNEEGSYEVILTVTDEDGLSNSDNITIEVDAANIAPVAVAQSDKTQGEAPLNVMFTASASTDDNAITAYNWTIAGTSISNAESFDYTFTESGVYEVNLKVTDAEGLTATDMLTINVEQADVNNDFALRINAGGPEVVHNGQVFASDRNFVDGKQYTNTEATVSTLFQSERSSLSRKFDYVLPVPDGTYTVNLYFAEIYWGANGGGPGGNRKRVFDVVINGDLVLNNYDVNADVGPQTEVVKTYEVTVSGGQLVINFSGLSAVGGIDQPKLSALEVVAVGDPVNQAPKAIVSATPLSGNAPLEVLFTGSNSTDDKQIVNYLWSFEDGATSTIQDPVYTFTEAGDYVVTLQVEDEEGLTSSADVTISVSPANTAPEAVASATPLNGTAPHLVNFTGSNSTDDNEIVSYSWIFGDGGTASVMDPEYTYTTAGTYYASLTVTDAEGLTDTTSPITIQVEGTSGNDDVAIYLNTGSSVNVNFEGREFVGDVSLANLYNSAHTYANPNASTITLYQTERGSAENLETLSYAIPVPNGTYRVQTYHNELWWGKGRTGGAGKRVFDILIENDLVKDNFDIFKVSNNNPTRLDFNNIVVTDGVLNIDLPATADRASISGIAIESSVNQKPVAVASATPKTGSAPLLVNFDASVSRDDVKVTGYLWQFEPGVTSTEVKPDHVFTETGTYTVSLTVTDAQGLSDQTSLTIQVNEAPNESEVAMYLNTGSATNVNLEGHTFVGDINTPSIYNGSYTYEDSSAPVTSLYRTERGTEANLGTLNYAIPVPNGIYTVSTYHAELWWGKKGSRATAGKRVFDILIEGNLVKDNFDIFRESNNRPTKLSFYNIEVKDGILNMSLPASVDKPTISGIAIEGSSVNRAPVAIITATPKTGTAPFEVSFNSDNSTDDKGIVAYRWDFKDGSVSTQKNPRHVFATTGNYNVSLRVTDGEGLTATAEVLIEANGCNAVPEPWSSIDVGDVAAIGSTCYNNGEFSVSASGADIWGSRDEFHFVYRQLTGDGEIIARLSSLTEINNWTKAGVMMRAGTAANAKHALMTLAADPTISGKGSYGYAFQSRSTTGGSTLSNTPKILPNAGLPYYVRLVRTGNSFTGYISQTNGNWTQVSSATISMDATIQVGIATTSHKDGTLAQAVFNNVSVRNTGETSAITAAPLSGVAPLRVDFNSSNTQERAYIDASLTYFWEFQDGKTSTKVDPKHTFEKAGFYPVSLTVKRGEEVLYQNTVEVVVDGVSDGSFAEEILQEGVQTTRLYPNPASTNVTLEVAKQSKSITKINIFDVRGRMILEFDAEKINDNGRYYLNVESLEAGVYMLTISGNEGLVEQKRLLIKG
ncbi:PKD domain-containing protein [Flavimarina sp. Hel_I_48]|uniref:PKD domain-containing protein n=1 Tax=Flavimarina sp. Hel_I_48 TaxID=1392488 RepID=UPI0004DEE091|nr:PKD domain-containing protein [Flavimarina sp. Hel_I_48]